LVDHTLQVFVVFNSAVVADAKLRGHEVLFVDRRKTLHAFVEAEGRLVPRSQLGKELTSFLLV
jgi:hypothetical protein